MKHIWQHGSFWVKCHIGWDIGRGQSGDNHVGVATEMLDLLLGRVLAGPLKDTDRVVHQTFGCVQSAIVLLEAAILSGVDHVFLCWKLPKPWPAEVTDLLTSQLRLLQWPSGTFSCLQTGPHPASHLGSWSHLLPRSFWPVCLNDHLWEMFLVVPNCAPGHLMYKRFKNCRGKI